MAHRKFATCIEACNQCANACDHCATACLKEKDPRPMARCIALDVDCAEMCRIAAAFMARGGEFAGIICGTCADICQACGEECARHDMPHCQECAEACRLCAAECRSMSTSHGSATSPKGQHAGH
jgi:hypothetical protein